jgi:N-acetylglucosaminyldiphosphoundecaprenol N-acetyl-beta-D-mannosaminyltransferase
MDAEKSQVPVSVDDHQRPFLFGMPVYQGTERQFLEDLGRREGPDSAELVVTANVDQLIDVAKGGPLREAYAAASSRVLDGVPLVKLGRLLGGRNVHRITGADLIISAAAQANRFGWRIAITGGQDDVVAAAAERLRMLNPGAVIEAVPFPYVSDMNPTLLEPVISALTEIRPDIVFICLGSPKQERFFLACREALPPAIYVGAGAAVDFAAARKSRAPQLVQRLGAEWLYRLVQEPRRLGRRYLVKGLQVVPLIVRSLMARSSPGEAEDRTVDTVKR